MSDSIMICSGLSRTFGKGKLRTKVLSNISLEIKAGERVAILGSSGSGKSTLLHLLGGLDRPDSGTINIKDEELLTMNENQRTLFRNKYLGFVYQFHHLLPEFDALENVCLPLWISGRDKSEAFEMAKDILVKVGLGNRLYHRPAELSGGERQRVAIARAMVTKPALILADEPTGNLDSDSANSVFDLMSGLNQTLGTALLIVTHDEALADKMDRKLLLHSKSIE